MKIANNPNHPELMIFRCFLMHSQQWVLGVCIRASPQQ